MRVAGREVSCACRERAPKSGNERFLKHARAEWLRFIRVERTETTEDLIARADPMVQAQAELVDVAWLLFDGHEVLNESTTGRFRHVLHEGRGDRIDPLDRNLVVGERLTHTSRWNCQRVADRRDAGEPALPCRHRRDGERASPRSIQAKRLVAREEERAVLQHRTAKRSAELVLPERRRRLALGLEVVRRVEHLVTNKLEASYRGSCLRRRA